MKKIMRKILSIIRLNLNPEIQNLKFFLGQNAILASRSMSHRFKYLWDAEVKVFSQWGEDGIIQALIKYVPIERKIFVEFGVQNYTESNTRFLLINDCWSGLLIDGDKSHVDYIKNDPIYWRHNLKVDCSFITRDNINLMTFIISGPKDTPYENGLFEFHAYLPNGYPNVVPQVLIKTTGNGKVVYFDYSLPSNLIITGLSNNTCYNVQIYAINGNGYSANFSSTPASFNLFTGNLVSSLIAY
jgi:hypothetical protein